MDRHGFTGEGGLVCLKALYFYKPDVCRYLVSCLDLDQIPGHYAGSRNFLVGTVTLDYGGRSSHFLQGIHGFFGSALLDDSYSGVQGYDYKNNSCITELAEEHGDCGSHEQNEYHGVVELFHDHIQNCLLFAFFQYVFSGLAESFCGLSGGKAVSFLRVESFF